MNEREQLIFYEVYERGSVTEAAKALFYTNQNVSKSLKALEDQLDVKLFKRIKNGLIPTTEGDKLYKKLKEIDYTLTEINDYYKRVNEYNTIRILNSYIDVIGVILTKSIEAFDDDYIYTLSNCNYDKIYNGLLNNQCDIGVFICDKKKSCELIKNLGEKDVYCEVLGDIDSAIYINKSNPLAFKNYVTPLDLKSIRRISLYDEVRDIIPYLEFLERFELNKNEGIKTNTIASLMDILRDSGGYYIGPFIKANKTYLDDIEMIPLIETEVELTVILGYRDSKIKTKAGRYFLSELRRIFEDN